MFKYKHYTTPSSFKLCCYKMKCEQDATRFNVSESDLVINEYHDRVK